MRIVGNSVIHLKSGMFVCVCVFVYVWGGGVGGRVWGINFFNHFEIVTNNMGKLASLCQVNTIKLLDFSLFNA